MALTKIFVALLLVGIMPGSLAAPDQTAELEKSNVNGDAQDASVAIERLHRPIELEDNLQGLSCSQKFKTCYRIYSPQYCSRVCYFQKRVCKLLSRVQEVEGSIQDALVAPYQPAEFEAESEHGDVQRISPKVCLEIYHLCKSHYKFCVKACDYHYHLCMRGIVAQDAKDHISQDFAAPDQIEAVERPDRPVELEEDEENGDVQLSKASCKTLYRVCRHLKYSIALCMVIYFKCQTISI